MKVGNIVNGMTVTDVKRINKMNLIQFTKAVSEYIENGYKIDVHSSRQVGALQLMVDMYKLESNSSGNVSHVGESLVETTPPVENNQKEESSEEYKARLEKEGFSAKWVDDDNKESDKDAQESNDVKQEPPVKKTTRSRKQTT